MPLQNNDPGGRRGERKPRPSRHPLPTLEEQLGRVATDLGLADLPWQQDWGVEQADPARVDEFVGYFAMPRSGLGPFARAQIVDLVLQSAEEALEAGVTFNVHGLRSFVLGADRDQVAYWLALESSDADRWLVVDHLRRWAG